MTLETISACLSALDADDASLRATIALRLGILQADFRGDRRKACQVCGALRPSMVLPRLQTRCFMREAGLGGVGLRNTFTIPTGGIDN